MISGLGLFLTAHSSVRVSPSDKMTGSVVLRVMFGLPVNDNHSLTGHSLIVSYC